MRRIIGTIGATLAIVGVMATFIAPGVFSAMGTRSGGETVSDAQPIITPAGGPYFGKLDPAAHYYVKIDNTGDGVEDVAYRWHWALAHLDAPGASAELQVEGDSATFVASAIPDVVFGSSHRESLKISVEVA